LSKDRLGAFTGSTCLLHLMRNLRLAFCCLVLAFGATSGGCGPSHERPQSVSGKVTFADGTPLANARVIYESQEKRLNGEGATNDQGEYKISTYKPNDGAVLGVHRVAVVHQPPRPPHDEASGNPAPPDPPPLVHENSVALKAQDLRLPWSLERRPDIT